MALFLALDRLAAARGDGLDPRLRALFEQRQTIDGNPKVSALAEWRGDVSVQAGPHPAGVAPRSSPDILPFRRVSSCEEPAARQPKSNLKS